MEVLVSLKTVSFLPEGGTRVLRMHMIPARRIASSASPSSGFLQAWFENETDEGRSPNWGAISGLALSLAISASFWIGTFLLVERLLK